jgi:type II secretory pathway pseudopilin PulG
MGHRTPRGPGVRNDSRGVTAVELLVVIGIVVLLAVVALVSVRGIRDRQRTSACKAELAKVKTAVEAFTALPQSQKPSGALPASLAVLKFSGLLDGNVGRYVAYQRVRTNGHWVAHYANGPKGNCV